MRVSQSKDTSTIGQNRNAQIRALEARIKRIEKTNKLQWLTIRVLVKTHKMLTDELTRYATYKIWMPIENSLNSLSLPKQDSRSYEGMEKVKDR